MDSLWRGRGWGWALLIGLMVWACDDPKQQQNADVPTGPDQTEDGEADSPTGDDTAPTDTSGDGVDPGDMVVDGGDPPGPTTGDDIDPNTLDQDRLFVCEAGAVSSPSRIRRLEAVEWAKSIHSDNALRVPLLPGSTHRYTTYSSDETLDPPTIREYMRYNGYDSWTQVNGNGYPRLAILRNDEARELAKCFQWNWDDSPVEDNPDDVCIAQFCLLYTSPSPRDS